MFALPVERIPIRELYAVPWFSDVSSGGSSGGTSGSIIADISLLLSSTPDNGSANGTVTVAPTGGFGGYAILWDSAAYSATTPTVQHLPGGREYGVTVSDASGNRSVGLVFVGYDLAAAVITVGNNDPITVANGIALIAY